MIRFSFLILAVVLTGCSSSGKAHEYLSEFFKVEMERLKYDTYQFDAHSEYQIINRNLIDSIVATKDDPINLDKYVPILEKLLDAILHQKPYLAEECAYVQKLEGYKKQMHSDQLAEKLFGIYMISQNIVAHDSKYDQHNGEEIFLLLQDTILLERNKIYHFDYEVRPPNSKAIYYNALSSQDEVDKFKIEIDTRNINGASFSQTIQGKVTNSITLETQIYSSEIFVKLK